MSTMPIASLKPNDRNPRTITPAALKKLSQSIERDPTFMELRPIIIDGQGVILGGNQRFAACKKLGMTELPASWVRTAEGLTDEQQKRFILVDNAPEGMAGEWDLDRLLADWQVPELGDLGFDMADLAASLPTGEEVDAEPQTDRAEELRSEWGVEAGQLWALGDHRLLCGDSTKAEDVARLMGGASYELLMIDPPYGIKASAMTMGSAQSSKPRSKRLSNVNQWDDARPPIKHLLVDKSCVWGGNYFAHDLPVSGDWLCWHKKNDGLSFGEFELAWCSFGKRTRHFAHHWGGEKKEHITQKPVAVIAWAVKQSETTGLIADFFLGSGTTLIAAEQLGRKCYGMEISPAYCAVILQRFKDATGKTPTRMSESGTL